MSSRERWPSASNPQTPTVLAAFATRLSDTVSELQALSDQAFMPSVLCLPGADRDSAFTNQSSGSQKVAFQLRDRGCRSSLTTGGSQATRKSILVLLLFDFPDEPSLTPIIYPLTPFDIATRQKTLPCAKCFSDKFICMRFPKKRRFYIQTRPKLRPKS